MRKPSFFVRAQALCATVPLFFLTGVGFKRSDVGGIMYSFILLLSFSLLELEPEAAVPTNPKSEARQALPDVKEISSHKEEVDSTPIVVSQNAEKETIWRGISHNESLIARSKRLNFTGLDPGEEIRESEVGVHARSKVPFSERPFKNKKRAGKVPKNNIERGHQSLHGQKNKNTQNQSSKKNRDKKKKKKKKS